MDKSPRRRGKLPAGLPGTDPLSEVINDLLELGAIELEPPDADGCPVIRIPDRGKALRSINLLLRRTGAELASSSRGAAADFFSPVNRKPINLNQFQERKSRMATTMNERQLRKEFRCELNLPQARISITCPDMTTVQETIKKLEPRAQFKQTEDGRALLVFNSASETDPNQALAVISEVSVPQAWNIHRKAVQRAA